MVSFREKIKHKVENERNSTFLDMEFCEYLSPISSRMILEFNSLFSFQFQKSQTHQARVSIKVFKFVNGR